MKPNQKPLTATFRPDPDVAVILLEAKGRGVKTTWVLNQAVRKFLGKTRTPFVAKVKEAK